MLTIGEILQALSTLNTVQGFISCLFDVIEIVLEAVILLLASLTSDEAAAAAAANAICNAARRCAGLQPLPGT